jgi:hypothetical protein
LEDLRNKSLIVSRPDGWLYDKEVILEYILHQKTENLKKTKEYEKQKSRDDKSVKELVDMQAKERLEKFIKTEGKLVSSSITSGASSSGIKSKDDGTGL